MQKNKMEFKIIRAAINHIEKIGQLLDLYRQFYSYDSKSQFKNR